MVILHSYTSKAARQYKPALYCLILILLSIPPPALAYEYELNKNWHCIRASGVNNTGEEISNPAYTHANWLPAAVPGTVLTSQLLNKQIPDPFYGMNNKQIPDIYTTGPAYYTYWFVNDFSEPAPTNNEEVMLTFRGVNYSYDVFLNGQKLNEVCDTGMFCRSSYIITKYLNKAGSNRLAVIVYPPSPVGNPNGGQGGDGTIAHSLTNQYAAGWDWIQPIADRNTGIWDKVYIKRTGPVHIENTHVVARVPGRRSIEGKQQPAFVTITTELENTSDSVINGTIDYLFDGRKAIKKVKLMPHTSEEIAFPELQVDNPRLWWPNGYGPQNLCSCTLSFIVGNSTGSDVEQLQVGIRQITTPWNTKTSSREIRVNGQKIFIKGGNWILTDALLRTSARRYDDEVRYHRDMNLNLIRVWGGGITERPEFYDACDKYGLLVMQDFWASGDCNGRWYDPLKLEDTTTRRNYPDNHKLFTESAEDQVKMLRNHPSLALWCGGNEIRPPADVLSAIRDSILPTLDGTRFFFEFSNDDSMSLHGGDGPYVLQNKDYFWSHKSFPFNSEIGSVGIGDLESLKRFIPNANLVIPYYDTAKRKWITDSVWQYHRYEGYDSSIEVYGHPTSIEDFAQKAQLVNYDQYRALMEGASAHMWDWYTGIIIWKTQNPWTAMKGQMYDYYLDPNACLSGTSTGSKPLHIMYDHISKSVLVANNHFAPTGKLEVSATAYTMAGDNIQLGAVYIQAPASTCKQYYKLGKDIDSLSAKEGMFIHLTLTDSATNNVVDENMYWLPNAAGSYTGLQHMPTAQPTVTATEFTDNYSTSIEIVIANPAGGPVAFFQHLSVVDKDSKQRVLPAYFTDNYFSVPPGQQKRIILGREYSIGGKGGQMICVEGWNNARQYIAINKKKQ